MAWKNRGHRRYYYRSVRSSGKVVSEYLGTGNVADYVAVQVELRRNSRQVKAVLEQQGDALHASIQVAAEQLENRLGLLVKAVLYSRGYHRHDRGRWRKRRVPKL